MGSNGGGSMRSQVHEAVGVSVPPPVGQYGEEHRLLRRGSAQAAAAVEERCWEQIINEVQTVDALKEGKATAMVGELAAACSAREMVDKQLSSTTNDLERLRFDLDPDGRYVNSYLAVKSFQRSDASKTFTPAQTRSVVWCRRTADVCLNLHASSDILPVPWLYRTQLGMSYKFLDIYNFLRDRFRGLWQDLTIQHAECHQGTIEVLEISCRLLILAEELLCDEPEFNAIQNGNLLSTCLDKLMSSYDAVREANPPEVAPQLKARIGPNLLNELATVILYKSPHEAEFWCYRIILCLSTHDASASYYVISKIPQDLKNDSLIILAVQTVRAFYGGNATRFFKYGRAAPPLVAVLIAKFTNLARHGLLAALACDSLKTQAPQIPAMTFCIMFSLPTQDSLSAYCDSVQARLQPTDAATPLSDAVVDVRGVDSNAAAGPPKAARLKRTPDEHLRHILNTFPGGRLRLLDPRVPYQADVSKLESTMISTSSMFYNRNQRVLPLSKLALHTDSPRLSNRHRPSSEADRLSMLTNSLPRPLLSVKLSPMAQHLSPRLGFESASPPTMSASLLPNVPSREGETNLPPPPADALSVICSEEGDSEGERTRKRGPCARAQAVAKKQKNEEKKGIVYDIQNDLYAHPTLYDEFISAIENVSSLDLLNSFGTQAVTHRLGTQLATDNLSLPDPTAVCFSIKTFGSVHSPLPAIVDALMLGTPESDGALQIWSCSMAPLPSSPSERFIYRSALWLKEKGAALGAVAIYYTSDRSELAATRPDLILQQQQQPSADRQMCNSTAEGKGCDQSSAGTCVLDSLNDDASSLTDSFQQSSSRHPSGSGTDLPALIYCCSAELLVSRNALDTKVPWRVDNPKMVLAELERLAACHKSSCRGLVLCWLVRIGNDIAAEDEHLIAEAIRQSVQKNLAVQPSLQKALLPLFNGGDAQKSSVPKNCCIVLVLKKKKRGSRFEPLLRTLQAGFDLLASTAYPSVMWPQARTCSLPFVLLNVWKKEINDSAKPSSEVSEMVQCLDTGLSRFLKLPYWHEDIVDCRLQMQFGSGGPSEFKTVRKIFKKLKKACVQAVALKVRTHVEKEQARKSLNIQTPVGKAPNRLVEARQIVRSVIKTAISNAEDILQTPLLRAKFMLPLPLQIWTQTQHIKPWYDGLLTAS